MTLKLVGFAEVVHVLLDRLSPDSSIVLFGGQAKDRPYPGSTTVSTVNGGISGLARTLAWELAPIRVNAIHPGITGDSPYWHGKPPAILEGHPSKTITKKLATMDDIVDGTRFLLENPSVEGIDLVVDNGRHDVLTPMRAASYHPRATRAGRPDYPEMGERLREARRARNLSLRVLAERLGVSPSLISQIETGRANPSVSTLYAIAAELDVSLDELLFNDRRPPEPTAPVPARAHRAGTMAPAAPVQRARGTAHAIRLASGVNWERLTTLSEPGIEFLHVTYEVGGASSPPDAFQRHPGTNGATS